RAVLQIRVEFARYVESIGILGCDFLAGNVEHQHPGVARRVSGLSVRIKQRALEHDIEGLLIVAERQPLETAVNLSLAIDRRQRVGDGIVRTLELEPVGDVAFQNLAGSIHIKKTRPDIYSDPRATR